MRHFCKLVYSAEEPAINVYRRGVVLKNVVNQRSYGAVQQLRLVPNQHAPFRELVSSEAARSFHIKSTTEVGAYNVA